MLEKNENLGRKSLYEKSYELKIKSMKPWLAVHISVVYHSWKFSKKFKKLKRGFFKLGWKIVSQN
jgi:hypothetical protein